jgi:hypothetical protein
MTGFILMVPLNTSGKAAPQKFQTETLPLFALLLDRPQPVDFVLVGIISGWRRDQLRALNAEVVGLGQLAAVMLIGLLPPRRTVP